MFEYSIWWFGKGAHVFLQRIQQRTAVSIPFHFQKDVWCFASVFTSTSRPMLVDSPQQSLPSWEVTMGKPISGRHLDFDTVTAMSSWLIYKPFVANWPSSKKWICSSLLPWKNPLFPSRFFSDTIEVIDKPELHQENVGGRELREVQLIWKWRNPHHPLLSFLIDQMLEQTYFIIFSGSKEKGPSSNLTFLGKISPFRGKVCYIITQFSSPPNGILPIKLKICQSTQPRCKRMLRQSQHLRCLQAAGFGGGFQVICNKIGVMGPL